MVTRESVGRAGMATWANLEDILLLSVAGEEKIGRS